MLKAYTKPAVTRVNLVPAEAVLTGCKHWMVMNFEGAGDNVGCCTGAGLVCHTQGS